MLPFVPCILSIIHIVYHWLFDTESLEIKENNYVQPQNFEQQLLLSLRRGGSLNNFL